MNTPRVERRLAAILAADVAGYSRLMGVNEVGTLRALNAHRRELIDPAIAAHHGRIVKTTGDGLLAEFPSIVEAIASAVAIQRGMLTRNIDVAPDKRQVLRIGLNIGDIIIEGGDIFGDGVNVAARLEALCEPGGICISRAANEQVRDKLSIAFADLGEHLVKNISRAVGVYGLSAEELAKLPEEQFVPQSLSPQAPAAAPTAARLRRWALAAAAAALAAIAAGGYALMARKSAEPDFAQQLATRLEEIGHTTNPQRRAATLKAYIEGKPHRAYAVVKTGDNNYWTGNWTSRELAETRVLERCQISAGEACMIVAVDDTLASSEGGGPPAAREAASLAYAGAFDAAQLPFVRSAAARRDDVAAYPTAKPYKAAAIHPGGALQIVSAAATQEAANAAALRGCNEDDSNSSVGGHCFLYAEGDMVVLPHRRITSATGAAK